MAPARTGLYFVRIMKRTASFPHCPRCGMTMALTQALPRVIGRPELRRFVCTHCQETAMVEVMRDNMTPTWAGG